MRQILVVDDNPATADEVEAMLLDFSYTAHVATSSVEALRRMRQHTPDAVLLDLDLPMLDSWRFLEACRKEPDWAAVPIVVLSSTSDGASAASRFRPHACLTKPTAPVTLMLAMEQAASVPRSQRSRVTII